MSQYLLEQSPLKIVSQKKVLSISMASLLLCMAFLWVPGTAYTQTATSYVFTTSTGAYTNIAGTQVPAMQGDDVWQTGIPIGFNFNYCGISYNTISASSNGWLQFPGIAASQLTNSQLNAAAINNMLMPLWDDLDGATGTAWYTTTGTSPNQVFTIEYRNWEWNWQANNNVISFQVKLYETSNVIEYWYSQGPNPVNAGSATIGIFQNNTSWQSLQSTAANPVSSTSLFEVNLSSKPATGQIYRWSPPVPCNGAPTVGASVASPSTIAACSGSTTLNLASFPTTTGINYQWQSGPSAGGPWTNVGGVLTSPSFAAPTINTSTYYQCIATCTNTNQSTISTPVLVTVGSVTVSPATASICLGSSQLLTATAPAVNGVLYSETFDNGPTTMAITSTGTPGTQWTLQSSPYFYVGFTNITISSPNNNMFMCADADNHNVISTTNTQLTSPVLNTTGFTSLNLAWNQYFQYFTTTVNVEASINGGLTWTSVASYNANSGASTNFAAQSINMNAYINQPNFMFRFNYIDGWGWHWAVDDIILSGTGLTPSYSWTSNPAANAGLLPGAAIPSPVNATTTVTPTATGTYTYTVTSNAPGCTTGSAVVTVTNGATATMTVAANPICSGQSTTVNFNGSPNATVTYKIGAGPNQIIVLSAAGAASVNTGPLVGNTTYTLVSVSQASCSTVYNTSITITVNPVPVFNAGMPSNNGPICSGNTLNLFAGTTPAVPSYSWTGPAFGVPNTSQNPSLANAQASYSGIYTVVATTALNCSVTGTTTVVVNQTPAINVIGFINPTSCGGNQGNITFAGMTPSTNYTLNYTIPAGPVSLAITSTAAGQYVLSGLSAGTYSNIYITQNGCNSAVAGPVTLTDPAPPNISGVTFVNPTSCGGNQGTITISGLLSNTAYTYSYNNLAAANMTTNASGNYTITGLTAGVYSNIYVIRNNCTSNIVGPVTLSDPNPPLLAGITFTNPTSCGGSQGTITLNVTTALAAPLNGLCTVHYTSSITGIQNVPLNAVNGQITITNLPAGNYTNFSFTTALNCTSAITAGPIVLTDPNPPVISGTSVTSPTACGGSNGSIILHGLLASTTYSVYYNAVGPLSLTSNAAGDITIANLPAATYNNIYVILLGCISSPVNGVIVSPPNPPVIAGTTFSNPNQCQVANGSITLLGLLPNTSYAVSYDNGLTTFTPTIISNGAGSVVINGLLAGTYNNFFVTLNNCVSASVGPITLTEPGAPVVTAFTNAPICEGQTLTLSSVVTLNGNPAAANSYSWTGPAFVNPVNQANPFIVNAPATATGIYTVTATIAGCVSAPFTLPVTVYAAPATPILSINTPLCSGNDLHLDVTNIDSTMTYIWTGPGFPTPDTTTYATVINAQVSDGGTYNINVTNPYGCGLLVPVTALVTINQTPNAPVPNDVVYCQVDAPVALTATQSGNPADTLKWYTVPTGGIGSTTAPVPSTVSSGNFTWYVSETSAPGCEGPRAPLSVWVKQKPLPPTTTSPEFTYCQQDSTAVALIATGDSLQWYNVATGGIPSSVVPIPSTSNAGVFNWYVTQTIDGCESNRLPITVTVLQKPQPPVTKDLAYCQYDSSVILTAVGQNLKWYDSPLGGIPLVMAPTPSTVQPGATTWYVSQTVNGCESDLAAIKVTVYFHPTAGIASSRDEVCQGDTLLFTYVGNGTQSASYLWTWPSGTHIFSGTGQGPYVVQFNNIGTFNVTLIATENGCSSPMASHTITVKQSPNISIGLRSNIVCTDDPAYLEITWVDMEIANYSWDFAGAHTANGSTTESGKGPYYLNWSQPGTYVVTLDILAKDQCWSQAQQTVVVHERPEAKISASVMEDICTGDDVTLSASVNNSRYTYKWLPAQLFDYDFNSPVVKVHADKTTYVSLEVTNEYGCSSMDSLMLHTKTCCEILLPTAFSPNGDGKNDLFRIINPGRHKLESLKVYNRFGQEVFTTSNEKEGWNGSYNGVAQDMGVYQYMVKYICEGKETYLKGDVTLVR